MNIGTVSINRPVLASVISILIVLFGIIGFAVMIWQSRISDALATRLVMQEAGVDTGSYTVTRGLGAMVVLLNIGHVTFMGYQGWFKPDTWHGGMPPITLLAFLLAIVALAHRVFSGRR